MVFGGIRRIGVLFGVGSVVLAGCAPAQEGAGEPTATSTHGLLLADWFETDVGSASTPPSAQSNASCPSRVTVYGYGRGINDEDGDSPGAPDADQYHYVYRTIPGAGDYELVVKLLEFDRGQNPAKSHAGVAIRTASDGPYTTMGAASISLDAASTGHNKFFIQNRLVDAGGNITYAYWDQTSTTVEPPTSVSGCNAPNAPPVWMRLQRLGEDFSTAYSQDGVTWIPMGLFSGGAAPAAAATRIGFFVSSSAGSGAPLGKAVFDIDYQGAPRKQFDTTWIGSAHSASSKGRQSPFASGIYADPTGRVYKVSQSPSELTGGFDVYKDGELVRRMSPDIVGTAQGAITGDPTNADSVFVLEGTELFSELGCVRRYTWANPRELLKNTQYSYCPPQGVVVGGLAARDGRVYLSSIDAATGNDDRVRILDQATLAELTSFQLANMSGDMHPTALAADGNNRLWVVGTVNPRKPAYGNVREATSAAPVIQCYSVIPPHTACANLSPAVNNPIALSTNAAGDRLYVADNGPAQVVRAFSLPANSPPVEDTSLTLGALNGVYGSSKGQLYTGSDGWERFYNLMGLGVDGQENLYVLNSDRIDVRAFGSGSSHPLLWKVFGISDSFDFDPNVTSGVLDLFSARERFKFDTSVHTPGGEWSFNAVTSNVFANPERNEDGRLRRRSGSPWVRRVNGSRFLFVQGHSDPADPQGPSLQSRFSTGRGYLNVYRFDQNDVAIPAASLTLEQLCKMSDGTGDILPQPGSIKYLCKFDAACTCNLDHSDNGSLDPYSFATLWVDTDGDGVRDEDATDPCASTTDEVECSFDPFAWPALATQLESQPNTSSQEADNPGPASSSAIVEIDDGGNIWLNFGARFWRLRMNGVNSVGAPLYRLGTVASGDVGTDASSNKKNFSRLIMTAPTSPSIRFMRVDAVTDTVSFHGQSGSNFVIGRYTDWFGTRTLAWSSTLPNDWFYTTGVGAEQFFYTAFDVAGDKYFIAEHFGRVRVHEASDGSEVARLSVGAEASGFQNWNDAGHLRAIKVGNEYLISVADSATAARTLMFRFTPPAAGPACTLDSQCNAATEFCDNGTCAPRACNLSSPFGSMTRVLPGTTSTDGFTLSPNGLKAFFSHKPTGTNHYDIYSAERSTPAGAFGALTALSTPVNSNFDERAPFLSSDLLRLYYWSKNTSNGNADLMVATRSSATSAFSTTGPVASSSNNLNSSASDEDPYFLEGENTIYFTSDRPTGDRHVYVSTKSGGVFGTPALVSNLVSGSEDSRPVVSRDNLTIFFKSQQPGIGGDTDGDIWLSQRASTSVNFPSPTNLSALNSWGCDFPVALSADGCSLYLASNREHGGSSTQVFELYQARRQATPDSVIVTMNVTGNGSGSVLTPYSCAIGNVGTCSASQPFGSMITVNASRQAYWSGTCMAAGTGSLSTDAHVAFNLGGTCNVTFP
jgi:hypothetical protein